MAGGWGKKKERSKEVKGKGSHRLKKMAVSKICLIVCLVCLCPSVRGYFTNVDAHAEECFFDKVSSGMKMGLTFEVVEGGFLDIDVKVRTPIKAAQHN